MQTLNVILVELFISRNCDAFNHWQFFFLNLDLSEGGREYFTSVNYISKPYVEPIIQ
jgi:hypothetical protein